MRRPETFKNEEPITDLYQALDLLFARMNDRTRRTLWNKDEDAPYIEVASYASGYTGEEYTSSEYWRVHRNLVHHELVPRWYVQGTKHWGYTDYGELKIAPAGIKEFWRLHGLKREKEDKKKTPSK